MAYGMSGEWDTYQKLIETGLNVAVNGEHNETIPLGRSEWIKFVALFFNREREAEKVFNAVADRYNELAGRTAGINRRPKVLTEAPFQGNWWVAGGGSYLANFIYDAGASYLWKDDDSTGSLRMDFEIVYSRGAQADFWINTGTWRNLAEGLAVDERIGEFGAFKTGNVYNNNARLNEHGWSDYWESGLIRPDIVLADLIKIFHPHLVPEHDFVYYQRLQP
jgi:iron complex transport system substrate-binding protein